MKSKPVALKQGKAVSKKSKSEKTSMKSKPVAFKQGKAVSKLVNSHVDNGDGCSHYQLQPGYNLDDGKRL